MTEILCKCDTDDLRPLLTVVPHFDDADKLVCCACFVVSGVGDMHADSAYDALRTGYNAFPTSAIMKY